MFESIIRFSIKNKPIVGFLVIFLIGFGIYSITDIPIDAVPDITNNQVQVVTSSPSLSPQEVEKFITYPLEVTMANIKDVVEIRSVSRYGLSVVTIVFKESIPVLDARQLVNEQLQMAKADIPESIGSPEMLPITTGLGEVFQYTLDVDEDYKDKYTPTDLRTIHDWIVKRQLSGIHGIVEISSFGGFLKQYEVAVDPLILKNLNLTISDVFDALENNNENTGGSYIEKGRNTYYIRAEGLVENKKDIENIVIKNFENNPVLIRDVAAVSFGHASRFGAMTKDGKGEAVGGITLMLKGANSSAVIKQVKERVIEVQKSLPEGIKIVPYLDRAALVKKTIGTVTENLILGGLIVIFILVLLLGHFRSGLIVASVIPLSLLFAFIMMRIFGVSANLMSLGAIDFGIVIDGAVIIIENIVHRIYKNFRGETLSQEEMDKEVGKASGSIYKSAAFGVIIILIVFIPIMTLTGIEGKTFKPMAQTFSFAILGAFILSMTYVPMMAALLMQKKVVYKPNLSEKIIRFLKASYHPVLKLSLRYKYTILSLTVITFGLSIWAFTRMGGEFLPTLEEGDLAMQMTIPPGSSLSQSIETSTKAEQILLNNFPEVISVVSKIGTAEVPTDPMAIEDADIMILLKDKKEWTSAKTREDLIDMMKEKLSDITEASFEFTQPIQLRFNELMTGVKTDIAVKIYGEDLDELFFKANEAADLISGMQGASDIKVEQITGLPQYVIKYDRQKIARYGVNINDLNDLVKTSFAGKKAGVVFEGERKFDLVVRLDSLYRNNIVPENLFIRAANGNQIPLSEVADIKYLTGPAQISRDNTKRRVTIGINVRNRDVESLVEEISSKLSSGLKLKPGYHITYGGQFENLENARKRLQIAVPLALIMILILLFFTFNSVKYALLIFTAVPLSAVGGIAALLIRGMPFSISAGVGFIALFGIAVLNGIVLISYYNEMRESGIENIKYIIIKGACTRLRPVMMTAITDVLGFLPMAISASAGAEVQRPLATVVIGGLISSTLLTMIILPILYLLFNKPPKMKMKIKPLASILAGLVFLLPLNVLGQDSDTIYTAENALEIALKNNPEFKNNQLQIDLAKASKNEGLNIPATSFSYQKGQINSYLSDQYIEINQSLGSILTHIQTLRRNQLLIAARQTENVLLERQQALNVSSAYNKWMFSNAVLELYEKDILLYEKYIQIAQRKYDLGEIDFLEKTMMESSWLKLKQEMLAVGNLNNKSKNDLKTLLYITSDIHNGSESYREMELQENPDSLKFQLIELAEIYYNLKTDLARQNLKIETSAFFPELSAGYFNQHINNVSGFEGWQVGLSFPILGFQQSSKIKQARIIEEIVNNQNMSDLKGFEFAVDNLILSLYNAKSLLNYYRENGINQSDLILSVSQNRYSKGDINYLEFLQALTEARNLKKAYAETLFEYNEALLNLKYFVPKN
jgi:cobalt-zinc-cadmium resistance protein CzcA